MASVKHKLVIVESPAKAKTISRYLGKDIKLKLHRGMFVTFRKVSSV